MSKNKDYQVIIYTDFTGKPPENIETYYLEHDKWPYVVLRKFGVVLKYKEHIKGDFIILHDADTGIKSVPPQEFFSMELFGVEHMQMDRDFKDLPFERNIKSMAYVPYDYRGKYRQSLLMGGKREHFLDICALLDNHTNIDLSNGIIAKVHDESHWNYILTKLPHTIITKKEYLRYFNACDKGGYTHKEARGESPYQLVK